MGDLFPRLPGRGPSPNEVELGYLLGAFGVRGEVRVFLHNPESELLRRPIAVVLVAPDGVRSAAVLQVRPGAGRRILGQLAGLTDPELASSLRDHRVVVPREALGPLAEGELWVGELEGSEVEVDGERVGRVTGVHHTAGPDVLEIDLGGQVRFVPLVRALWIDFDAAARCLRLAPGALDEDPE